MSPTRMARIESAIRVVLDFTEAFNHHDVEGMMGLTSADCILETACPSPDGERYFGRETITRFWRDFFNQSPHTHLEIEDVFSAGFHCIMRWKLEWTDAAGVKSQIRGMDMFKVQDGAICEQYSYTKGKQGSECGR